MGVQQGVPQLLLQPLSQRQRCPSQLARALCPAAWAAWACQVPVLRALHHLHSDPATHARHSPVWPAGSACSASSCWWLPRHPTVPPSKISMRPMSVIKLIGAGRGMPFLIDKPCTRSLALSSPGCANLSSAFPPGAAASWYQSTMAW